MAGWARSRAQRIEKARRLIRGGISGRPESWADLGCGDGIFTSALVEMVGTGGKIFAVDRDPRALQALQRHLTRDYSDLDWQAVQADFTGVLELEPLDGVLMANALHFYQDKARVLASLMAALKPGGKIILVEYNTYRGNAAVPYPLDEHSFLELVDTSELMDGRILARIPSSFLKEMYAGLAFKPGTRPTDHPP